MSGGKKLKKQTSRGTSGKKVRTDLFDRIVYILEQAKIDVVRAVNSSMIIAYWYIGKEIVEELQKGKNRAEYGTQVIKDLSSKLNRQYGRGFSVTNLKYFRMFYQLYSDRLPAIRHKLADESIALSKGHKACDLLSDLSIAIEKTSFIHGFSSCLSWSHYRILLQVENNNERLFYEIEAEKENWSVTVLERQIHTFLFARLLKSRNKAGVMDLIERGQIVETPSDLIKHPYILDFLGLPEEDKYHEKNIESAIIQNIQSFLLELGKGFAFIKRQYRMETDSSHFYIDLVFYNYILKCFVLIDLKIGELTHQDVGQMDMYVRMFDDLERKKEDNPTIGLILCAEKDEVVVKYSVLKENKKIFASKYMLYLPTEKELEQELTREQRLFLAQKKFLKTPKIANKKRK
ncbi:MAG TPA: PDDEXK nuclease domain-containing protein [Bacteriovoracaceae bacterium]|nr:PDDEXK nuclease domain-containing protein [Bacteriovoracaceae bacterium]